jgi:hypothetical protein
VKRTVNGWDIHGQVQALVQKHPQLRDRVDPARVAEQQRTAVEAADNGDDFGASAEGGRGESYVLAQQSIRTRVQGIDQLTNILTLCSRAESDIGRRRARRPSHVAARQG